MKIFLAAPLTRHLGQDPQTRDFRFQWTRVIDALEAAEHDVFSAHRRERWGAGLYSPEDALVADLKGLRESDLVVAYVGSPPSSGVQLEIGYSLAFKKPLLVFVDRGQEEPYLLRGIVVATEAEIVEIDRLCEIPICLAERKLVAPLPAATKTWVAGRDRGE
jgi:nucleoside 2-deoxyribosyltransferase